MRIKRDRKGSAAVFLTIFFAALLTAVFAFVRAAQLTAVKGCAEALGQVWAQAVLAEYDRNLQKRYGIFGFYAWPREIRKKINFYAMDSFKGKKYINYGGTKCSLYEYSLINADPFKRQVVEEGKLASLGKLVKNAADSGEDARREETSSGGEAPGRESVIRNRCILDYLPSKGCSGSFSVAAAAEVLKDPGGIGKLLSGTGDRFFINRYIDAFFRDHRDGKSLGKTFFQNEVEYLITGRPDDRACLWGVRNRIVAVREIANFAYLQTDKAKYGEALAAAELITPGPAAAATCRGLLASWALAESINDYALLINGHKVPAFKTEKTWAVDLYSVINSIGNRYIFTGTDEGEGYSDYLGFFLYIMDERVLLLRMMDLIQINMKYLYYDDFLLKEYSGGIKLYIEVDGNTYETEKEY